MKDRLYDFMSDLDLIIVELMDTKNMLELHLEDVHEVNQCVRLRSIINIQMRMVGLITDECIALHKKVDETILELAHDMI